MYLTPSAPSLNMRTTNTLIFVGTAVNQVLANTHHCELDI